MVHPSTLHTGSTYNITYTNADGVTSVREIDVFDSWSSYGNNYIKAYCKLTNEERTFRLDRIESAYPVIDLDKYDSYLPESPICSPPPALAFAPGPAVKAKPSRAATSEPAYKRPAGAHPFLVTLSAIFVLSAFWAGFSDEPSRSSHKQTATAAAPPVKVVKPLPVKTAGWQQAVLQRQDRYRIATGFGDGELLNIYTSADLDYDNTLSWQEIEAFQSRIRRLFKYQLNSTAITPPDFMTQGGGDCEDWSLFTCGLLRFWGYRAYVGVVDGAGSGGSSHAIALFYKKTRPSNSLYSWYEITDPEIFYGISLPPGYYLPIDYENTGSFSNASKVNTPLRSVYVPEEIYNRLM